ncbi:hypothetical protein SMIR_37035 [Streptomyces mirabilis]|uniref:hypothetical protein n=1 Tax=Streptomyces mirabilis TaxID=68239 RepID=UPI001BB06D10|nr:hypothetical protein [Streptomyces mirabilis]QUW85385.1 hypothetical protein SMIR_37035 [Streptomyces mirabilis]
MVRETFGMESVALLERESDVTPWTCTGRVGTGRTELAVQRTLAEDLGGTFHHVIGDDPMVVVDPGLLERSVANLVENAVKYWAASTPGCGRAG